MSERGADRRRQSAESAQELRAALAEAQRELRLQRDEQARVERELEETNRGVVALYAELDDRAERLRVADAAKSRFLSGVSHELRTPLNSILALAGLLIDRSDGPLSAEQERQVEYIRESADDLLDLVNGLLDLSRIEAGRTEITVSEFALAGTFARLDGELRPLLDGPDVILTFERSDGCPCLLTDEGKLAQIVRNFVSNAIKYTVRGEVRVRAIASGDRVRIEVADTGIGVAPRDQGRIFEEFTQLPGPLQKRRKGTGLGLPLSRALATVLAGRVGVESSEGGGSTFWVELPLRHPSTLPGSAEPGGAGEPDDAAGPPPSRPVQRATALVVDDDPVARYVAGQVLRAEGYRFVEATGGLDGLARAREARPDVIVLDLTMPDLDGGEVLARLKEDADTASIPVVICSARQLSETDRSRLEVRVAAIVPKGSNVAIELRDALRELRPLSGDAHGGRPAATRSTL